MSTSGDTDPEPSAGLTRAVYTFAPLNQFSLKERWLIRLIGLAGYAAIRIIGGTIRWRVDGWEHFERARASGRGIIFTFWHNRVFLATYFWRRRGIVVMTSQSFDGEYIARFIQRFGYGAARGSSSRGAGRAFLTMLRCLRAGMDTAFTIDGPRGPRYVAKQGATILAKTSGCCVLPFHIACERYWEARSWDRFQIPKPFSRATMLIGEPIEVPGDASLDLTEQIQARLQTALDEMRYRIPGGSS